TGPARRLAIRHAGAVPYRPKAALQEARGAAAAETRQQRAAATPLALVEEAFPSCRADAAEAGTVASPGAVAPGAVTTPAAAAAQRAAFRRDPRGSESRRQPILRRPQAP